MKAAGDGVEEMGRLQRRLDRDSFRPAALRRRRPPVQVLTRRRGSLHAHAEGPEAVEELRGGELLPTASFSPPGTRAAASSSPKCMRKPVDGAGAEQGQQGSDVKWPPFSEVLVSDMSAEMLELAVDLAYHVPLQELVGTHNVLQILEVAEALSMSAPGTGPTASPPYQMAVSKGYKPLIKKAFRFLVRNFEQVWTTSSQFQSLAFEELWNVLHDDELHVANEVQGFRRCYSQVDRRGARGQAWLSLPTSCPSRADMQSVEAEPLVREDEEALELLCAIRWTLDIVTLDSEGHPLRVRRLEGGGATSKLLTYNCRSRRWVLHPDQCTPPRAYHGVAMLNGLVYFIGGFDGRSCYHSVVCLDVPRLKWSTKSSMNMARCYVSVALLQGYIYAMGGFDGEGRTSSCERYDASRNQWEFVASMHDVRSDASAVAVTGRIYVMGGFTGLNVLDTVEFYDPTADVWTRVRSMSTPRSGLKAVVHGDDVYVMGGFDGAQRLNSAERMDVRTGRWTELPSMVFPRSNFVAALLEGSIYVAGGFNGTTTASLVERYDIEARQWHRATDLTITCSAASAFVYHDVPNASRWF
ncbi:hypothetical protein HPB48_026217 [Haemaphysalis longicornis]|uniref:BACK domain-containing protein n=1 Tax=Haemaphysalis longicornis TaxID=44386 RepID=A0A9J6HBI7_HAELO|nr:hypothetical protein HPB48_026217 [Haemaphysalis longicornis]